MSVSGGAIGELPIGAESSSASSMTKPPKKRQVTAKADVVQRPEPR
jgi:hypothetical protein